ncbi:Mycothiol acetyltransferase [Sporomusa rhizae]|uniref:GNAT family N-acetyltransferase n=1 Tax=Sporomusa rhizae TaxID=357999 RepID=UPI00352A6157
MVELITTVEHEIVERLVELEQEVFGHGGMNEWHLVPVIRHGQVFVIKEADLVIGCIQYMLDWNNPHLAYMIGVSVTRQNRGKGTGTKLLKKSIDMLFADKITEIELTVDSANVVAVKIYKKLGFEVTEFRQNEYGEGHDRLVMVLAKNKFIP